MSEQNYYVKVTFENKTNFSQKKNRSSPRKAVGDMIPVLFATTIAIPEQNNFFTIET